MGYLTIKLQNSDLLYILTPRPTPGHDPGATVPYIKRSCFRDFPLYLIRSFVTKQKWVYKKEKMYVSSFHSVSLCFVTSIFQIVWSVTFCFRDFQIYILFVSFVTEQKWVYKKKMYVSSFHSVSSCFVTSFEQDFWSVTSCFRVFPIYLNRFICYEAEMGL